MLVNEAWLKDFVSYDIPTDVLIEQLTMAGLEVDSVSKAAPDFTGILVGEVLRVNQHPNADKLKVCKVQIAQEGEPLDIVCGASNVREGLRVPVATVGAVLPGDFKIKKSKLRGEPSHGMLCSEQELGLADSADGLMELPNDAPIGVSIREYLALDDTVIEVDLTPNRADCLSIEGVAREISCFDGASLVEQTDATVDVTINDSVEVQLQSSEDCPRYLGRVIKGVNATAETPLEIQERLRRCGLRSLGPIIDITNYVLLELGQPLHAFDLAKIEGDIHIRKAKKDEALTLLNDQEVTLQDDVLVIADTQKALAFAGVMGGAKSAVNDQTTDVFLECAFFTPTSIAGKSRDYGLHTDSSHRFERGVDPELCYRAIERATELILSLCGGQAGPITEQSSDEHLPKTTSIPFRPERVARVLGLTLDKETLNVYFNQLGMQVEQNETHWLVTPPSYRFDMSIEADLIEEVARLYGYNRLPQNTLELSGHLEATLEQEQPIDRIKDLLVDLGYQEAITYSFMDEASLKALTPNTDFYRLKNPISEDLAVMRTTLWAGLLKAADANIKRNEPSIKLFETGLRFTVNNGELLQEQMLSMLVTGRQNPEQWGATSETVDFYDVKRDIESMLELTGLEGQFQFEKDQIEALHPGQTAALKTKAGELIGYIGLLHPTLEKTFAMKSNVFLVELKQEYITKKAIPAFEAVSKFPSVRRDLALIVDNNLAVSKILDYICSQKGIVNDAFVFDVYQGKGIESGRKSIALGLILLDNSKTLTDNEVDEFIAQLLANLNKEFNAQLRDS